MGQSYETLTLARDGGVATLTLARAQAGNALGAQSGRDLRAAALDLASDPTVRAVLLKAEGKAFCVGGDLSEFKGIEDLARAVKDMTIDFHAAFSLLARMEAPLISAIQGAAAGAGLSLVCLSDYAIANRAASFTVAYPGVGFSSDGGMTWLLPRLIGLRAFQSLVLTGRMVRSDEALALGIISEIVDDDILSTRAETMARDLANGPTRAYGAIRRLTLESFGRSFEAHLEQEGLEIARLAGGEDARGAISAVLQRTRPTFQGR